MKHLTPYHRRDIIEKIVEEQFNWISNSPDDIDINFNFKDIAKDGILTVIAKYRDKIGLTELEYNKTLDSWEIIKSDLL